MKKSSSFSDFFKLLDPSNRTNVNTQVSKTDIVTCVKKDESVVKDYHFVKNEPVVKRVNMTLRSDLDTSIATLSESFVTWHRLETNGLVRHDTMCQVMQDVDNFKNLFPSKLKVIFLSNEHSVKVADGKYSKVYQFNHLAYKVVKVSDVSNLRCNIKELVFFHSFSHLNIMKPFRSQILMESGKITRIIHEMPLALAHFGDVIHNISTQEMVFYLRQIALALHYMHSQGIVHGDVKPANMLLFQNNILQLSDFSLSNHMSKSRDIALGTLYWRAPECLLEQGYYPSSDVWSFGVIMLDCLVKTSYFENAKTNEEMLNLIRQVLSGHVPIRCDECFRDLLFHCLVWEPEKRFTFQQVLQHPFFGTAAKSSAFRFDANWFETDVANLTKRLCSRMQELSATYEEQTVVKMCRNFLGFLWRDEWSTEFEFQASIYHILELLQFRILG